MAQAAPAFTAAAYYIMDSASELLRTTMPTNDEVRAAARVIAQKLGHLDPDEMGIAVGESVRPVWMDWEDTARAALVAAEKIRERNS
jgi:plastocyanin